MPAPAPTSPVAPEPRPDTSSGWERWHDWHEISMRPVSDWLLDHAEIVPGARVLDLASGTGIPSLACAARVAPGGRVIASDVSPDMLAIVRRNAERAALTNLETRAMPLEALALDDASVDVVTCSFGLMFSTAQERAVREIRRVLVPGGRFAVAVWALPDSNPFFTTVFETVARFMPPPPNPPKGPSMFGLGADGALRELLDRGGLPPSTVETLPFEIEFASVDEHWESFSDMAPPVKSAREKLGAADLVRLRAALADAIAPTLQNGRPRLRATAVLAAGRC